MKSQTKLCSELFNAKTNTNDVDSEQAVWGASVENPPKIHKYD